MIVWPSHANIKPPNQSDRFQRWFWLSLIAGKLNVSYCGSKDLCLGERCILVNPLFWIILQAACWIMMDNIYRICGSGWIWLYNMMIIWYVISWIIHYLSDNFCQFYLHHNIPALNHEIAATREHIFLLCTRSAVSMRLVSNVTHLNP